MFGIPSENLLWFAAGTAVGLFLAMLVFALIVAIERRRLWRRLRIAKHAAPLSVRAAPTADRPGLVEVPALGAVPQPAPAAPSIAEVERHEARPARAMPKRTEAGPERPAFTVGPEPIATMARPHEPKPESAPERAVPERIEAREPAAPVLDDLEIAPPMPPKPRRPQSEKEKAIAEAAARRRAAAERQAAARRAQQEAEEIAASQRLQAEREAAERAAEVEAAPRIAEQQEAERRNAPAAAETVAAERETAGREAVATATGVARSTETLREDERKEELARRIAQRAAELREVGRRREAEARRFQQAPVHAEEQPAPKIDVEELFAQAFGAAALGGNQPSNKLTDEQ